MNVSKELEQVLLQVQKPARYTGGELNSVVKDPAGVRIRFAFCFPDLYEVGMSHLGMKILYDRRMSGASGYLHRIRIWRPLCGSGGFRCSA